MIHDIYLFISMRWTNQKIRAFFVLPQVLELCVYLIENVTYATQEEQAPQAIKIIMIGIHLRNLSAKLTPDFRLKPLLENCMAF